MPAELLWFLVGATFIGIAVSGLRSFLAFF